jgi:Mn-dependent DtxR family transcriptional regulator
MYLETVLKLQKQKGKVRAIDVAEELNYARSSVSRGINLLKKQGLLTSTDNDFLVLTKKGYSVANKIFERHEIITKAFILLGASQELAEDNACRVEHVISDEVFDLIKVFLEKNSK